MKIEINTSIEPIDGFLLRYQDREYIFNSRGDLLDAIGRFSGLIDNDEACMILMPEKMGKDGEE